jgi:Cys-tRNA(Pro)/Cys-tRNA(Cys) deacylase
MDQNSPASLALKELGVPHRVFRHSGPVASLEQAAQERGERPEQVVRSIVFRLGEGKYTMVLVAGPAQISWKKLRQRLGQSRVTMASETEVLAVTGYRIGAVSPFGLLHPLRLLIDAGVLKEGEISLGSGIRGVAIILNAADLQKALKQAEVVQLLENS